MSSLMPVLGFALLLALSVLAIIFLVVPLLKGLGYLIGAIFNGLGWLVRHVFEFIGGMLTDIVRFFGAIIAFVVLVPLSALNVIIGRWSAAGHFGRSMKRECGVASQCLYRVVLQRPLRFLLLGGLLEGIEERVNEAVEAVPTADTPRRRTGTYDGYTIVGSLPGGGSGAKLYVAEPSDAKRVKNRAMPDQVVIKSFTITDGSSLPQIVRESRALEAAKQLGLVLDHGMDEHRFFYVMPYHQGDHLGIITREVHGRSSGRGLDRAQLSTVLGYVIDLVQTLSRYHDGGLWHKDVKPDNIIIHDGRAHVVDLGLVTPLRSAMTLTTHGTEYFRDPEMVRMALRGVKVHQVDGAKFDIYAIGAVLYFVIENTFPAHGGLSSFGKQSPEAVRWVVRRAMADYNKRYETAELVLADLRHIAGAADPFQVKPAELPSMRGPGAVEVEPPEVEVLAAAATPVPPPPEPEAPPTPGADDVADEPAVYGFVVGAGPGGVKVGRFGKPKPAAAAAAVGTAGTAGTRPKIRVTNWWTGAYEVLDPGTPGAAPHAVNRERARTQAKAYRDSVLGMRRQASELRRQVRDQAKSARRAAREQVQEARTRARQMQRRAREHRYMSVTAPRTGKSFHKSSTRARQPSGTMAFLTLVFVGALLAVSWKVLDERNRPRAVEQVFASSVAVAPDGVFMDADIEGPLTLLVLDDHPAKTHDRVQAEIERIVSLHRDQGWQIVTNDDDVEVNVRQYFPINFDPSERYELLREALLDQDLGGVIWVRSFPGDGPAHERIQSSTILLPDDEEGDYILLGPPAPEAN